MVSRRSWISGSKRPVYHRARRCSINGNSRLPHIWLYTMHLGQNDTKICLVGKEIQRKQKHKPFPRIEHFMLHTDIHMSLKTVKNGITVLQLRLHNQTKRCYVMSQESIVSRSIWSTIAYIGKLIEGYKE